MGPKKEKNGAVVPRYIGAAKAAQLKKEQSIMGLLSSWIVDHQIGKLSCWLYSFRKV